MRRRLINRRAFSLIELIVVIGILSVLMALMLPAVQRVRQSAQQTQCLNNLRQIGISLRGYEVAQGSFPPGFLFISGTPTFQAEVTDNKTKALDGSFWLMMYLGIPYTGIDTAPGWGWGAYLLPYLEQEGLASQINFRESVDLPKYQSLRTSPVPIFQCPSDYGAGVFMVHNEANSPLVEAYTNSYGANYGATGQPGEQSEMGDGVFYRNSKIRLMEIRDGLSTTLAIGERAAMFVKTPWAGAVSRGGVFTTPGAPVLLAGVEEAPTQVLARTGRLPLQDRYSMPYDFFSPHGTGANFLFCDGSVRRIGSSTSLPTLIGISTRQGNEVIDPDF